MLGMWFVGTETECQCSPPSLDTSPPQDLGGAAAFNDSGFGNVAQATKRFFGLRGSCAISGSPMTFEPLLWERSISSRAPAAPALPPTHPATTGTARQSPAIEDLHKPRRRRQREPRPCDARRLRAALDSIDATSQNQRNGFPLSRNGSLHGRDYTSAKVMNSYGFPMLPFATGDKMMQCQIWASSRAGPQTKGARSHRRRRTLRSTPVPRGRRSLPGLASRLRSLRPRCTPQAVRAPLARPDMASRREAAPPLRRGPAGAAGPLPVPPNRRGLDRLAPLASLPTSSRTRRLPGSSPRCSPPPSLACPLPLRRGARRRSSLPSVPPGAPSSAPGSSAGASVTSP